MMPAWSPSPNFNDRRADIDMIVLHYTGMESGELALARMCDATAEVSAHYLVWEDGRLSQLVDEDKRAWHAGVSRWQGDDDLNSRSIGIEIVNGGHDFRRPDGSLEPYPVAQIETVIDLCLAITQRWQVPQTRIVGHSDIAPARKTDPGEHFPWQKLAAAGIGLVPGPVSVTAGEASGGPAAMNDLALIGRGVGAGDTGAAIVRLQEALATIGYDLDVTGNYAKATHLAVMAFQRRWVQNRVTGQADLVTLQCIERVAALYRA